MQLLLDTNVVVWILYQPDELNPAAQRALVESRIPARYSAAAVWELAMKQAAGKLPYRADQIAAELQRLGLVELPITTRHGLVAGTLPLHHKDPFDRIIIAQALVEGLLLVSRDTAFAAYGIPLLQA